MKKRVIALLITASIILTVVGCGTQYSEADKILEQSFGHGYFTTVKEWSDERYKYSMMYANDTKVMYLLSISISESRFDITPLFNPDGTLQVYGEGE